MYSLIHWPNPIGDFVCICIMAICGFFVCVQSKGSGLVAYKIVQIYL